MSALTKDKVSVSYVIDRHGHIYELFDPKYWAYHLGMGAVGGNKLNSSRSIGIELSNYGPLTLRGNNLETAYSQVSYKDNGVLKKTPIDVYCTTDQTNAYNKLNSPFRGNSYFASITDEQYGALKELVDYLCNEFSIPKQYLPDDSRYNAFTSTTEASTFSGITSHVNYRIDGKWDVGPDFDFSKLNDKVDPIPEPTIIPIAEPVEVKTDIVVPSIPNVQKTQPTQNKQVTTPKQGIIGFILKLIRDYINKRFNIQV
jgi:hypothetical protein